MYMDPLGQQIEGTMDVEILQKEVSSVVCPDICFDNFIKSEEIYKVRRLYELNRLMSHLHIE